MREKNLLRMLQLVKNYIRMLQRYKLKEVILRFIEKSHQQKNVMRSSEPNDAVGHEVMIEQN